MPSPFPGMDPFIEAQAWPGFHSRFITAMSDVLVELLRPRYIVEVETYVFLETDDESGDVRLEPDVFIAPGTPIPATSSAGLSTLPQPLTMTLPALPHRKKQHYLTIRTREHRRVVTILELLSPTNKKPGEGQAEYQLKRDNIIASGVNLVELDLLRAGTRLATKEPLPAQDYFAFILRSGKLPQVDVYAWSLRDSLPTIGVPLSEADADARLDLQSILEVVYDRAGYEYALDYDIEFSPTLSLADEEWTDKILANLPRR